MRLASLSPAVTEILFALGQGGQIVCRDQFSDFPEIAKEIPKIAGHRKIDPEKLRSFQPDLVFTSTVIQQKLAEDLRAAGFEVIHQDPRKLQDVYLSFVDIGMVLDCEAEARALSEKMRQGMNAVKKRSRSLPRHPHLYIEEWPALPNSSGGHDPPMASGNWVPEVVRAAGGEPFDVAPAFAEASAGRQGKQFPIPAGELSREVSLEEIQKWDPEMIVLSICGAGTLVEKSLITGRAGWSDLRAVKEGNVRVIDDSLLNRPGPRLVEGAQRLYAWMFELLH